MLLWGALWSQAHLALVPAMAGTVTAQTGTFLACFAIAVATASAVTAVERGTVPRGFRSEEHTSELQSLMRTSYAVLCLKNKKNYSETTKDNRILYTTTTHIDTIRT